MGYPTHMVALLRGVAAVALAIAGLAPAFAQQVANTPPPAPTGIEEVVVTAEKIGAVSVQRTPIAISAFNARTLEADHIADVKDLFHNVPNLQVTQQDTFAIIYLRGVGTNNIFNGSDPSVTVHVDGVYYGRTFMQFANFLDVERVEVLRGPQGTLYGRNSVGGTINVISRDPGEALEAKVNMAGGNYGAVSSSAYISGPLVTNRVEGSLAASYSWHDPYFENVVPGGFDVGNENEGAARGQLKLLLSDHLQATTRADVENSAQRVVGFSTLLKPYDATTNSILGDYHKVALNDPNGSHMHAGGISEDVVYDFAHNFTLKSVTAYHTGRTLGDEDSDASDQSVTSVELGENQHQYSEELNLVGKLHKLEFVSGPFYFREHNTTHSTVNVLTADLSQVFRPATDDVSKALYTQGTYHFSDQFSVTVGGRYSWEHKDFTQNIVKFRNGAQFGSLVAYRTEGSYSAFTPRLSLNWIPTDDLLLYASATRGFKSGGFNVNSPDPKQGFQPEKLWSYEAGVKSTVLNHRMNMNLTGFIYDYTDLQVSLLIAPGSNAINNAAAASVHGVEFETLARPIDQLELSLSATWLDAKYTSYPKAPLPGGLTFIDASGHHLTDAPPYMISASAQYKWPFANGGESFARVEGSKQGRTYFSPVNDPVVSQAAYGLVNASLGYTFPNRGWRAEIYGRNLADKQYLTWAYVSAVVPSGWPGAPRTYGARFTWSH
jgi:iron complex outermembrane receptor protein